MWGSTQERCEWRIRVRSSGRGVKAETAMGDHPTEVDLQ